MMLIDEFIERVDWKKMIFGGLAALVLFIFLTIVFQIFFNHSPKVILKKTEFEYGEPVIITNYIESFDGEKVYPSMVRDSLDIELESRRVSFSPVNPKNLGEYPVTYTITDKVTDKVETHTLKIRVIDSTAPDLTVRENIEMDLDSFSRINAEDLIEDVSDTFSPRENIVLSMAFTSKAELGKTVEGSVTATDSNGNSVSVPVTVNISSYVFRNDEPGMMQEDDSTEIIDNDPGIDESQPGSASVTDIPQESYPVSNPSAPDPQPDQPVQPVQPVQRPGTQYFMFTDGYNMGNVENVCSAAGDASGFPYACTPIADGDGIYKGMVLTFD